MIWRLASKDVLKLCPFYIHLVLAVVVYFDFSLLLQESLEVTGQRKELIVDLRTAYVCFFMWLRTHQQPAWVNPRDIHGVTTFFGCCWRLPPIFSPRKGDYCILLLHFCSRSLSKTPHQQEYKVLYQPAGLSLRGFPLTTPSITASYCRSSI